MRGPAVIPGAARSPAPAATTALVLLVLAWLAVSQATSLVSRFPGIDFYQFWGVSTAMRLTGQTLGPPYRNGRRYAATLRAYAAESNDPKLKAAQSFWGGPDFAGTPLLYTAFAPVSPRYSLALGVFQASQMVVFVGGLALLAHLLVGAPLVGLGFALLCVLFYNPLLSDVRLGNLGCVQVAYLVGLIALVAAVGRGASPSRDRLLGVLCLAGLAALTLCKPNVVVITALLVAHLGVRLGARSFVVAAVPAAAVTAGLLVLPCLYFGDWGVWGQWYNFVYGANPRMLVRSVASGNFSTPLLVSEWLGRDVYTVAAGLLALLAVSLLVVWWRAETGPEAPSRSRAAMAAARRLLESPHAVVAAGIAITMATSPLFWLHYYVLALIPSLWLLAAPSGPPALPWLGAGAVAMSSGMVDIVFRPLQWTSAIPPVIALCWLPLWVGVLLHASALRLPARPLGAEVVAPPPQVAPAPRPRGGGRRKKTPRA